MRERESVLLLFLLLQAVVLASCTQGAPFILFHFVFGYFLFESPKFFLLRTTRGRVRAGGSRKENKERDPCYVKKPWHILLFDPLGTLFLPT